MVTKPLSVGSLLLLQGTEVSNDNMPGMAMGSWRWWWFDQHPEVVQHDNRGMVFRWLPQHPDGVEHANREMLARQVGR